MKMWIKYIAAIIVATVFMWMLTSIEYVRKPKKSPCPPCSCKIRAKVYYKGKVIRNVVSRQRIEQGFIYVTFDDKDLTVDSIIYEAVNQ